MVKWSFGFLAIAFAATSVSTSKAEETISLFSSHEETPLFSTTQETSESTVTEDGPAISAPEDADSYEVPSEHQSFGANLLGVASLFNSESTGHLIGDSEVLFLRYNSDLGNRTNNFGYEASPRFMLGYVNATNLGFRTIYFSFSDVTNDAGGTGLTSLDAYNLDFEVFKQIQLTKSTGIEMSGGLRYNEASYFLNGPTNLNDFHGIGVALGAKGTVKVSTGGAFYGRAKLAILSGTARHDTNAFAGLQKAQLSSREQVELGFGYEHPFELGSFELTPRVGAEVQRWGGYAIDPVDEHPESDLALAGFVAGLSVRY